MIAYEFNECRRVGLPIHRETFQIFERGADPETGEQGNGIFGIFVKVSVENPLIHEICFATDVKQDPSQVVKSERGESGRIAGYGVLYCFSVRSDRFFAPRFDFSNKREAIVGRSFGKIGPYRPCSSLKYPSLGIAIAAGFVQSPALARDISCAGISASACASLVGPAGLPVPSALSLACARCGQRGCCRDGCRAEECPARGFTEWFLRHALPFLHNRASSDAVLLRAKPQRTFITIFVVLLRLNSE